MHWSRTRAGALTCLLALAVLGHAASAQAEDRAVRPLTRAARQSAEITSGFVTNPSQRNSYVANLSGASVLREVREVDVPAGASTWQWTDIADTALTETMLVSVEGTGVTLTGHRIEETSPGPAGYEGLLKGQDVRATKQLSGSVVSLSGGVVLRVGNELTVLRGADLALADASKGIPRKQVIVDISAATAGKARIVLTALVPKLEVRAPSYVLEVDHGTMKARLVGHAALLNHTGQPYNGARLFYAQSGLQPWSRPDVTLPLSPSTWIAATGFPAPYPVPSPLVFAGGDVADALLIDQTMGFTEGARATWNSLVELREPTGDAIRTPIRRAWQLASAGLNLPALLPTGSAYVTALQQGGAAQLLGQAYVSQSATKPISVEGNTNWLVLESRRLTKGPVGECAATVRWEHLVPIAALQQGPLELEFPYRKANLEVVLAKTEGVTLVQSATSAKLVVTALPASAKGATDPRKFVVTYKTNPCK